MSEQSMENATEVTLYNTEAEALVAAEKVRATCEASEVFEGATYTVRVTTSPEQIVDIYTILLWIRWANGVKEVRQVDEHYVPQITIHPINE